MHILTFMVKNMRFSHIQVLTSLFLPFPCKNSNPFTSHGDPNNEWKTVHQFTAKIEVKVGWVNQHLTSQILPLFFEIGIKPRN